MTFTESIATVLGKYSDFTGRASRPEYWWFALFNFGISLILLYASPTGSLIWSVVTLLPGLAVSVRRLHDTARSGWLLLLVLVPIIGPITLIVFLASPGTAGDNTFGPSPAH